VKPLRALHVPLVLLAGLAAVPPAPAASEVNPRPNVLFVCFDDLGDWIHLLEPDSPIAMPNLERLAKRGVLFRRAYSSAPECNPSRTSLLSGRHPVTTGVYANASDWRAVMPDVVMLPSHFRKNGYTSVAAGKIFHHVHRHFHDDASFDEYFPFERPLLPREKHNRLLNARSPAGVVEPLHPTYDWGPSPVPEKEILDVRYADFAVEFLDRAQTKPFFLAVGFFLPHLPYFTPPRALAWYDPATMPLPPVKSDDLNDVGSGAHSLIQRWTRMFRGIQQHPDFIGKWREAIAAYAAAATFADEQFGRVLDALDRSPHRDNTIVVVWSDHGYHLGEKDHWTKFMLWEKSNRTPLIIAAPGVTLPGGVSDRPVALLDLYPTLVELAALPAMPGLDGDSLVPLLRDPTAPRATPVLTTQLPGNHAVRTDRWRYIRYADGSEELYDHAHDPHEWHNLAGDTRHADVIARHRHLLPTHEAEPAPLMTDQTESEFVP